MQAVLTEGLPSQETRATWLHAFRQTGDYPDSTEFSGKWLVWYHVTRIDRAWLNIKKAVEQGQMGNEAKVLTAYGAEKPLPRSNRDIVLGVLGLQQREPERQAFHVICVYTYDWTDIIDVMGIRGELRSLGVKREIAYKADRDTRQRRYGKDYTPIYRA